MCAGEAGASFRRSSASVGANLIFAAAGALLLQQNVARWRGAEPGLSTNRSLAEEDARPPAAQPRAPRRRQPASTRPPRSASAAPSTPASRSSSTTTFCVSMPQTSCSSSAPSRRSFSSSPSSSSSGDIIRNRTPLVTVGDYLLNLIPYILYNVTPLCSLVAVLITFGALAKTSELTAMKSAGLSLYRIVAPGAGAHGGHRLRALRPSTSSTCPPPTAGREGPALRDQRQAPPRPSCARTASGSPVRPVLQRSRAPPSSTPAIPRASSTTSSSIRI